jgi:hypothetical protein
MQIGGSRYSSERHYPAKVWLYEEGCGRFMPRDPGMDCENVKIPGSSDRNQGEQIMEK